MADINSPSATARPARATAATQDPAAAGPRNGLPQAQDHSVNDARSAADHADGDAQDDLVTFAELLFFAYRDFTTDADAILLEYGFGRAHHRVLHFVARSPGLRIANLLQILKITKQSLARVLRHLLDEGILLQKPGSSDRRERRLYATPKGAALAARLSALQSKRIDNALREAGQGAEESVKRFLFAMIKRADREAVDSCLKRTGQLSSGTERKTGDDTPAPFTKGAGENPWEEE